MKTRLAPASKLRQGPRESRSATFGRRGREPHHERRRANEIAAYWPHQPTSTALHRERLMGKAVSACERFAGPTHSCSVRCARACGRGARAPEVTHLRWGPHFSGSKLSWLLEQAYRAHARGGRGLQAGVRYDRFVHRVSAETSRHVRAVCLRLECCVHACLSRLGALIGDADARAHRVAPGSGSALGPGCFEA